MFIGEDLDKYTFISVSFPLVKVLLKILFLYGVKLHHHIYFNNLNTLLRRCPWCNGYRRRKWTR